MTDKDREAVQALSTVIEYCTDGDCHNYIFNRYVYTDDLVNCIFGEGDSPNEWDLTGIDE